MLHRSTWRSGLARNRLVWPLAIAFALALLPAAAAAQRGGYGRPAGPSCKTGPITSIFIDNHSIFDTRDPSLDPRFDWAYHLANRLHFKTHRDVIARELLFTTGDCYDPELARESGRLLRELPFLSRVDVYGIRQPDGSYHVVVDTQDDWSTRLGIRLGEGLGLSSLVAREENLVGTGQQVRVFYRQHRVARQWGIQFATPQFAATRWNLQLGAGRTRAGPFFQATVAYPFVGEVGRWSSQQTLTRRDAYYDYVRDEGGNTVVHALLPVRDQAMDLAVLRRFGPPGHVTVLGAGLSFEDIGYPGGMGAIRSSAAGSYDQLNPADSALATPVWNAVQPLRDLRAMVYFGQRNIWWVERQGLDAMRGVQDVPLGADIQFGLGRTLPVSGQDNDIYGTVDLYSGFDMGNVLVALRGTARGRRNLNAPPDRPEWQDVIANGEILSYWKPGGSTHQTLFFRLAGTGGWHTHTPFQLTLGGNTALRGYDETRFPGGRRVDFTIEDRSYFGWPYKDVFDLGSTLFVDAGRIWPGGVPFGVDSGWRASAGFGLRAAFPAGSRTTYRADIAFPIEPGGLASPRLIVSVGEVFGLTAPFADHQLLRSRTNDMFGSVFNLHRP